MNKLKLGRDHPMLKSDAYTIPHSWFTHLLKDTGKPHLTAIIVLSDIVYWYQKLTVVNKLQRNYQQIANRFGISKRQAQRAVVFLEEQGIITREFKTTTIYGAVLANVMYLRIIADRLAEINVARKNLEYKQQTSGYIYILQGGDYYKIGQSVNANKRVNELATKLPFRTHLCLTANVSDRFKAEKALHEKFANKRVNGEWFSLTPGDLDWIRLNKHAWRQ